MFQVVSVKNSYIWECSICVVLNLSSAVSKTSLVVPVAASSGNKWHWTQVDSNRKECGEAHV